MTTRTIRISDADIDALKAIRGVVADAAHHPGRQAAIEAIDRLTGARHAPSCTCDACAVVMGTRLIVDDPHAAVEIPPGAFSSVGAEKCPACMSLRCAWQGTSWKCSGCERSWTQGDIEAMYAGTLRLEPYRAI
jgi:hypothetical protein